MCFPRFSKKGTAPGENPLVNRAGHAGVRHAAPPVHLQSALGTPDGTMGRDAQEKPVWYTCFHPERRNRIVLCRESAKGYI
jgi:hypothetical protein